jgi:hypothetical protein
MEVPAIDWYSRFFLNIIFNENKDIRNLFYVLFFCSKL